MKAAVVFLVVVVAILAPMTYLKSREAAGLKAANVEMEKMFKEEQEKSAALAGRSDVSADELTRLREGNAELIKLRGEVGTLKRERDELAKKVGGLESAAARSKEREETARVAAQAAEQAAESAETERLKARANTVLLGAQSGMIRQKLLAGQVLTPEEQQTLAAAQARVAELEKTPAEFAQYQTAYIASALGWNNDPRSQQVQDLMTKVAQAALNRGVTFNAPGQSYENWGDSQKALDNRATGVVKGLLNAEEAAAFDKVIGSVMNANPAAAPRGQ